MKMQKLQARVSLLSEHIAAAEAEGCAAPEPEPEVEPEAALPRQFVALELKDGEPGVEFEPDSSGPPTIAALFGGRRGRAAAAGLRPGFQLVAIGATSVEGLPAWQALEMLRSKAGVRPLNLIFMNPGAASPEHPPSANSFHELSAVVEEEEEESDMDDGLATKVMPCAPPTAAAAPESSASMDEDGEDYAEQLEDAESRAEVVAELLTEAKARVARACAGGVAVQSQVAEIEKQEEKLRAALLVSNAATLHRRIEAQLPKLQTHLQEKSRELSDLQRLAARGDEEVENLSKEHEKLIDYITQLRILMEAENAIREAQQAATVASEEADAAAALASDVESVSSTPSPKSPPKTVSEMFQDAADLLSTSSSQKLLARPAATVHMDPNTFSSSDTALKYTEVQAKAAKAVKSGDYRSAIMWFERCLGLRPGDAVSQYNLCCCNAMYGELDAAIGWFKRSIDDGLASVPGLCPEQDSDLSVLLKSPRFLDLAATLKVQQAMQQATPKDKAPHSNESSDTSPAAEAPSTPEPALPVATEVQTELSPAEMLRRQFEQVVGGLPEQQRVVLQAELDTIAGCIETVVERVKPSRDAPAVPVRVEAEAELEPGPDMQPEPQPDPQPEPELELEKQPEPELEPELEPDPELGPEPEPEPEPRIEPKLASDQKSEPEGRSEAEIGDVEAHPQNLHVGSDLENEQTLQVVNTEEAEVYTNCGCETVGTPSSSPETCDPISPVSPASSDRSSASSGLVQAAEGSCLSRQQEYEELREQYQMALAEGLLTAQEEQDLAETLKDLAETLEDLDCNSSVDRDVTEPVASKCESSHVLHSNGSISSEEETSEAIGGDVWSTNADMRSEQQAVHLHDDQEDDHLCTDSADSWSQGSSNNGSPRFSLKSRQAASASRLCRPGSASTRRREAKLEIARTAENRQRKRPSSASALRSPSTFHTTSTVGTGPTVRSRPGSASTSRELARSSTMRPASAPAQHVRRSGSKREGSARNCRPGPGSAEKQAELIDRLSRPATAPGKQFGRRHAAKQLAVRLRAQGSTKEAQATTVPRRRKGNPQGFQTSHEASKRRGTARHKDDEASTATASAASQRFLQPLARTTLAERRSRLRDQRVVSAQTVQRICRGWLARASLAQQHRAAMVIQCRVRYRADQYEKALAAKEWAEVAAAEDRAAVLENEAAEAAAASRAEFELFTDFVNADIPESEKTALRIHAAATNLAAAARGMIGRKRVQNEHGWSLAQQRKDKAVASLAAREQQEWALEQAKIKAAAAIAVAAEKAKEDAKKQRERVVAQQKARADILKAREQRAAAEARVRAKERRANEALERAERELAARKLRQERAAINQDIAAAQEASRIALAQQVAKHKAEAQSKALVDKEEYEAAQARLAAFQQRHREESRAASVLQDAWRCYRRRRVVRLTQQRARQIELSQCVARGWLARRLKRRLELGEDDHCSNQTPGFNIKKREPLWQPRTTQAWASNEHAKTDLASPITDASPTQWAGMLRSGVPTPLGFGAGNSRIRPNSATKRRPSTARPSSASSSHDYDRITGRRLSTTKQTASRDTGHRLPMPVSSPNSSSSSSSSSSSGGGGGADGADGDRGRGKDSLPQIRRPASAPVGRRHAGKLLVKGMSRVQATSQQQQSEQTSGVLKPHPLSTRAVNSVR